MEVMTSQELLRQHMTDSAIEKTLRVSDRNLKKKKEYGYENCPQCDKLIKAPNLPTHLRTHLVNENFHCKQCEARFKTKKYLSRHVAVVHNKKEFKLKCAFCDKTFKFKDKLKQHEMIHTGEKPHKCDVCGKTFRANYSLNTHMLIHTDEKPFACAFCDYRCRDSSTIRKHQERHLGSVERFHCKLCTKSFSTKATLKVHIAQDHLNLVETKVECHFCERRYRDKQSLATHIKRIHLRSNFVQCGVCFAQMDKANLPAHLQTHKHSRVSPYKCPYTQCGKRFYNKADMKRHTIIHDPSQQKTCKVCGRMFARAHRYYRHVREGHQPRKRTEKCAVCKVMFYTRNHLLKHMHMKHSSKKKQYKCAHCNFTTAIKPSLIGHLKAHAHDQERECKICHTKYKAYEYLKAHYLKSHNIKYKPEKFPKVKKKCLRPKILDGNELRKLNEDSKRDPELSVEVKIEPIDWDEISEDLPLSDLKNLKHSEVPITGTTKPISMRAAQTLLAERITRRGHEFKQVEGYDDFVDRKIMNMGFRAKPTSPEKYLKISNEKDVNRLLRNAKKRKQIETEESERHLLDRMKRIYNERLMEAARKREKTETKQLKKILKVELIRDPILDSYFLSHNNKHYNNKQNITENNSNNVNDTDNNENDIVVTNDTSTNVNNGKEIVQIDTPINSISSKKQSEAFKKINESSDIDNNINVVSNDTNCHRIDNDNSINQESIPKPNMPEENGIKIIKTVSLSNTTEVLTKEGNKNKDISNTVNDSITKEFLTQETNKNTDINNTLVNNSNVTILCNGIDSNTNTSYWDISNKNEHRIVQDKMVLEINVELTKSKDGSTFINILEHNQEELNEISSPNCSDVKPIISNIECIKYTTNDNEIVRNDTDLLRNENTNSNILESNKISLEKQSLVSLKDALSFENDSEMIIKQEDYSENDVRTFDNDNLIESLRNLENCIVKSENDHILSENDKMLSERESCQIKDGLNMTADKDISKSDNKLLNHSKGLQNDALNKKDNIMSEGDKQLSQVTDVLSENDSPFIELYMPVSENENHNLEIRSHNLEDLNTHNKYLRLQDVDLDNNTQGLATNNSDSANKCRNSENERRDSENKSHDSENESVDLENETEDTNIPSTSKIKPTEDNNKYKKLNSKKIKFNTSQCYVCFKLFQTKEELLGHCAQHFAICSENRLKKCPLCSFVGGHYLRKHLLTKHNINIDQGKYNTIEFSEEGTYTIKVAQKPTKSKIDVQNIEIIPSIKQLNKQAYQKIDERNRLKKQRNIVKRTLVKKGTEWIVETENVKLNYLDYLVPIGKEVNFENTNVKEFDYLEQLTKLSKSAKKEDRTILYPCDRCELICTNLAALKAHRKSHDKIKTGKRKPKGEIKQKPRKLNKDKLKNKDFNPKLLEFFESNNVNGMGIDDFEQFTEIYKVIDNLSEDKLAMAATNKEYGLIDLPNSNNNTENLVETKRKNKIRKKYNLNQNSGYKKVVKIIDGLKSKREVMKSKLREKIKRTEVDVGSPASGE